MRWGVSQGLLKAIPRQGKEAGGDKIHLLVMTCHARLFGTPRVCSGMVAECLDLHLTQCFGFTCSCSEANSSSFFFFFFFFFFLRSE